MPYNDPLESLKKTYNARTKNDYIAASRDEKTLIANAVQYPLAAKSLSYRNLGSESLLELNCYDPSRDTPIEILHTILLGVAKYLINYLIKATLAKNQVKMNLLVDGLKLYAEYKSYTHPFSKELRHCGSFLGRYYKQLIQTLPVVISAKFTDPEEDKDVIFINEL